MKDRVLITGGAGFIGSRLARRLLVAGYEVSILDNFSPQIHGGETELAHDLRDAVQLFRGDVCDVSLCERALKGAGVLVHLAAETGTGQSMYRVRHYTEVNIGATASLMELLLTGKYPLRSMVVASSRAVYGEGAAQCAEHGTVYPEMRSGKDMQAGNFEPKCPICKSQTSMLLTSEDAPFHPSSLYGLTKQVQEQMVLLYAATLGMNGFALRYQNVYGPGQSLKNPYTGILAIFSNQARADQPIYIFEDGKESRDFVYVDDVVEATFCAVEALPQKPVALNVGTGVAVTVAELAGFVTAYFSSNSKVTTTGAYREGDIRHNCANTERLQALLGYVPIWGFAAGIREFLGWARGQGVKTGNYEQSLAELRARGLCMAKPGRIGVVTVTYNSANVLLPFLECLAAQTHREFLLFAVDNASHDATIQMLRNFSDERIHVIPNAVNVGVAEGNNQGITAALDAECSSVLLLNNDTEFDATLLEQLETNMMRVQVGMICPKIMYYDEPDKIWAAGGTFQPRYGYRSVHYGEGEQDRGQYDEQRLVTYVPTCCVLIAKEVFEKVGLMDARYFVYVDDVDFMYRVMKAGIRLLYFPRAKLLHKVSSLTGQEESISMIRFCTRNRVFFLLKHLGLLRSLPLLLGYQAHFLLGRVTGRFKKEVYSEKQLAVKRGYEMWRASLSEPPH